MIMTIADLNAAHRARFLKDGANPDQLHAELRRLREDVKRFEQANRLKIAPASERNEIDTKQDRIKELVKILSSMDY